MLPGHLDEVSHLSEWPGSRTELLKSEFAKQSLGKLISTQVAVPQGQIS